MFPPSHLCLVQKVLTDQQFLPQHGAPSCMTPLRLFDASMKCSLRSGESSLLPRRTNLSHALSNSCAHMALTSPPRMTPTLLQPPARGSRAHRNHTVCRCRIPKSPSSPNQISAVVVAHVVPSHLVVAPPPPCLKTCSQVGMSCMHTTVSGSTKEWSSAPSVALNVITC